MLHHTAAPNVYYSLHMVRPNKQLVCHDHCWSILATIYTVPQGREVGRPWSPRQQYRMAWQYAIRVYLVFHELVALEGTAFKLKTNLECEHMEDM